MIVSAAVKVYSTVFGRPSEYRMILPVHRHKDVYTIMKQFGHYHTDTYRCEDGFLTDEGVFLDRVEAADHAYDCGQLVEDAESERITVLMSEDLW